MSVITSMNNGPQSAALALLPARMDTLEARVLSLTIGLQESELEARKQRGGGPARGLHQFEAGGGVKGVLTHRASKQHARLVCDNRGVAFSVEDVWEAMETDDVLDFAMARLLLWTDPKALPAIGDVEGAWSLYARTWRPGAYTRGTREKRAALRAKFERYYNEVRQELDV